jgi:small subunit ribosomal protein S8
MLTRLRNANIVKSRTVIVIQTKLNIKIAQILKSEGFIDSFEEFSEVHASKCGLGCKYILITLKYKGPKRVPFITGIKRVSKSGLRTYTGQKNIPKVLGGIGIAVCLIKLNNFLKLKYFLWYKL